MTHVQRRRTRGWRMPEGAVYVGRPTRWGNEFRRGQTNAWGEPFDDAGLVELYAICTERFLDDGPPEDVERWVAPIRGRVLVCWCPVGAPCHADVLADLVARYDPAR